MSQFVIYILKNIVTLKYDVTLIYAGFAERGEIQMACSKKRIKKYLQLNNKTIIEFSSRRYQDL